MRLSRLRGHKGNFILMLITTLLLSIPISIVYQLIFPSAVKLCENTKISEDLATRIADLPLIPTESIKTVENFEKYLDNINYLIDSINAIFSVSFKFKKLKIMRTLTLEECLDLAQRYNALIEAAKSVKHATPTTKRDFCEEAAKLGVEVLILNIKQSRKLNLDVDEEIRLLDKIRSELGHVCGSKCVNEIDQIIGSYLCKYVSHTPLLNEFFKKFGIKC